MAVYETGSRAETAALASACQVLRSGSLVLFTRRARRGENSLLRGLARGLAAPTRSPAPRSPS